MSVARAHAESLLEVRGLEIQLLEGGAGPPLLFLHGAAAGSWSPALEELAREYRVLLPIHPGMGRSQGAEWIEGIDDLAFHYLDLLDRLGLEEVAVVGSSLGGWLAAELAVLQPRRVSRLVLVSAAGLRVPGAPVVDIFALSRAELGPLLFADRRLVEEWQSIEPTLELMEQFYRERSVVARLAWHPFFHDPKLARRLYRASMPTLIVWGADDRLIPPAHGREYRRLLPNARYAEIGGCGHLPHVERPFELARLVGDFLGEDVSRGLGSAR